MLCGTRPNNNANELRTMVANASETAFTYDEWGRTITQARIAVPLLN